MTASARLAALVAAALAFAGCAGDAPAAQAPPAQGPPPALLHLGECHGFLASTLPAPNAASPARPPPGWESPAGTGSVLLQAMECSRVSLGPIERGPVRLVAEKHTHFQAPSGCVADAASTTAFVVSLAVDDAELAAHLRAAYGLPALAAEIRVRSDPAGAGSLTRGTWAWGPPGQPPSDLTFLDSGPRRPEGGAERLFWMQDGAVGVLDVSHGRLDATAPLAGEGTLREPMLMAAAPGGGRFAGGVEPFDGMAADGVFRLYRDGACQEPRA